MSKRNLGEELEGVTFQEKRFAGNYLSVTMKTVTIPKGTVIHLNGCPCELAFDTEVYCGTILKYGLGSVLEELPSDKEE